MAGPGTHRWIIPAPNLRAVLVDCSAFQKESSSSDLGNEEIKKKSWKSARANLQNGFRNPTLELSKPKKKS